jgi:murein DD-endopeptidase MepM/ murein hydrolase activator NlpD
MTDHERDATNARPTAGAAARPNVSPDQVFHPTAGVHTQVKTVRDANGHSHYVYGQGGVDGQTAREHAANTHEPHNWQSRNGADIICPPNTPVYATVNGVVGADFGVQQGHQNDGPDSKYHGNRLTIEGPGNSAYYAHLDHFARGIAPGVQVHAGQLLGYSGVGGGVAHLHIAFEHGDTDRMLQNAAGRDDISRGRTEPPAPTRTHSEIER